MNEFEIREIVRRHIKIYNYNLNMVSLGLKRENFAEAELYAETLLQYDLPWTENNPKPELKGNPLDRHAQAIHALNELLAIESEGREYFIP